MIVVDTSVWVSFFRDPESPIREALSGVIDDDIVLLPHVVRVELISGSGRHTVAMLERVLGALELVTPSKDTWMLTETWAKQAAMRGLRFGVGDLLIAATAAERGAHLWTFDRDFEPMARLKWIRRFSPRVTSHRRQNRALNVG